MHLNRDIELARAIYGRISNLPGYDGQAFHVVGAIAYPEFFWGSSIARSVFHENNPEISIFKEIYGLPWKSKSIPFSPTKCPAFPADGSVFMYDGRAYACLNSFEEFLPLSSCVKIDTPRQISICLKQNFIIQIVEGCASPDSPDTVLSVELRTANGQINRLGFIPRIARFEVDETCYRAESVDGTELDTLTLS